MYEDNSYKLVYLTQRQVAHLLSLVEVRLTELTLAGENPIIITMYRTIKSQLEKS